MRVIAGVARSLPLKSVPGLDTRPTTDRIKETLFNILQDEIYGCRFLDLFSGSGAIGIEALSRGASEAVFVENNKKAIVCIKENLDFTRLSDKAEVLSCDVLSGLHRLESGEPFQVVFMDPPYEQEWERKVLEELSESSCITDDTLIVIEAAKETSFEYLNELGYKLLKRKEYKTNTHIFIQRGEGAN